jgi:hypothetical protein
VGADLNQYVPGFLALLSEISWTIKDYFLIPMVLTSRGELMSEQTQAEFKRLVEEYYRSQKAVVNLTAPEFHFSGFLSKAVMTGSGGFVEILCGPAEYHAEVFVISCKDNKRWKLADLMNFSSVREWLVAYSKKGNTANKSILESDVEWIFLMLADGLRDVPGFEWITSEKTI